MGNFAASDADPGFEWAHPTTLNSEQTKNDRDATKLIQRRVYGWSAADAELAGTLLTELTDQLHQMETTAPKLTTCMDAGNSDCFAYRYLRRTLWQLAAETVKALGDAIKNSRAQALTNRRQELVNFFRRDPERDDGAEWVVVRASAAAKDVRLATQEVRVGPSGPAAQALQVLADLVAADAARAEAWAVRARTRHYARAQRASVPLVIKPCSTNLFSIDRPPFP